MRIPSIFFFSESKLSQIFDQSLSGNGLPRNFGFSNFSRIFQACNTYLFRQPYLWKRLITRKYNPLSEEQAGEIHPDIEELLTKVANTRYYKKKNRQRLKVDFNATLLCPD